MEPIAADPGRAAPSRPRKFRLFPGGAPLAQGGPRRPIHRGRLAAAAVMVLVAVAAIVSTYPRISQTYDEPAHIAAGLEWWQYGRFTYEHKHPPLPRVAAGLGPYLAGARLSGAPTSSDTLQGYLIAGIEGERILHSGPSYTWMLSLARLGILPFFVLAVLVVGLWARALFGGTAALIAVFLAATLPQFLAHSGVATTDMALAATLPATVLALVSWLRRPDLARSALLGALVAASLLSKMSVVLYLPLCALGVILLHWRGAPEGERPRAKRRQLLRGGFVSCVVAFVVIWGGYRFSLSTLADPADRPYESVDERLGTSGFMHDLAYRIIEAPVPVSEFVRGVRQLLDHNDLGHKSYLLGEVRRDGWWYFFPLAFLVKTPIPLLVLFGIGIVGCLRRDGPSPRWMRAVPLATAAIILAASMTGRINIGSRHILPMYVPVVVIASLGALRLWRSGDRYHAGPAAAAALMLWQLAGTVRAHPDQIAYFNELAQLRSDPVLVFSDLDWGQDTRSLADTLQARGAEEVWIALNNNNANYAGLGFPRTRPLPPYQKPSGWIAVDTYALYLGSNADITVPVDAFAAFRDLEPVARVGSTIRLYHLP